MSFLNDSKTVLIKNIYYMLAYAFESLHESDYEELGNENFESIDDLNAEIIIVGMTRQLKQGLYKQYVLNKDDILTVKGTIIISDTMRNMAKHSNYIVCEQDDYSTNNLMNQILKTTMVKLCNSNEVPYERKTKLKQILTRFHEISLIDPKNIPWSSIQFRRNSGQYRMLITICRFTLEKQLLTESGDYRFNNIATDEAMSKLYEHFILKYYEKHCEKKDVSAKKIRWDSQDNLDEMPEMQSDVFITDNKQDLIIDAKLYTHTMISKKGFDSKKYWSSHLYQIYTYVSNHHNNVKRKVTGILLYAKTDESITPNKRITISGHNFIITTIDLNENFSNITKQLNALLDEVFSN